ncbi:MAG: MFS transporter [Candidatus Aminicenantes bacterium]|nr:MFS transporter [Candidatus Aminicenantes bacterium]
MIRQIKTRINGRIDWRQTFTALRYPNYRLWFWGQMISMFGTWMQATALGFLIFELTQSPAYLGLVGFANGVPTWLFMLYAGVVADRVSRRRLMVITQTAMMILAFVTAGLTFFHLIRSWHIIVLAFGFGVTNAFDAPARQAFVKELVGHEDMTNAIALNSAMFNTSVALGPAFGGVIYALFGPAWCFTINGLSFIAVIAALMAMRLEPFIPKAHLNSILSDLKEGLRYVVTHSMIRTIVSLVGVISLFGFAFATLMPAWAVKMLHGNATTNGFLQSARGFGALAAALLIASLGRFKFRGKLLTFGSFAFPVLLVVFAFIRWEPLSLLVLFGIGFALILVFNLANAAVQELTPDALRGRVMSIYSLVFFGSLPIGSLFIGWMAVKTSEPTTVVINSLIVLTYSVVLFVFMPKLRKLK